MRMLDCEECFAVPGSDSIIDVVRPDTGRSWYNGLTLEEMRLSDPKYEKAKRMTVDAFLNAKAKRQNTTIEWREVAEGLFYEMMEVLPPTIMIHGGFLVGEPADFDAGSGKPRYDAYQKKDGKFLVASRPLTCAEFKEQVIKFA